MIKTCNMSVLMWLFTSTIKKHLVTKLTQASLLIWRRCEPTSTQAPIRAWKIITASTITNIGLLLALINICKTINIVKSNMLWHYIYNKTRLSFFLSSKILQATVLCVFFKNICCKSHVHSTLFIFPSYPILYIFARIRQKLKIQSCVLH